MKSLRKVLHVLELIWLLVGLGCFITFVYVMLSGRRDQGVYFLVITFIAGVMYAVRKSQRKKAEAEAAAERGDSDHSSGA